MSHVRLRFIDEVPADMLSGGVPHPAASRTRETDPKGDDVPSILKGLRKAKIVPFRISG